MAQISSKQNNLCLNEIFILSLDSSCGDLVIFFLGVILKFSIAMNMNNSFHFIAVTCFNEPHNENKKSNCLLNRTV